MSAHGVVGNGGPFGKLCELIGAPELPRDPRFAANRQRNAHRDALKQLLEAKLMQFDCEPLADRLVRAGVPCAPIHDVPAALADPHTKHRGMVGDGQVPRSGVADQVCRGCRRRIGWGRRSLTSNDLTELTAWPLHIHDDDRCPS